MLEVFFFLREKERFYFCFVTRFYNYFNIYFYI